LDAQVITCQSHTNWVYTIPNMPWVPKPHIDDDEELQGRADGQFGAVGCFQWCQLYCKEFEYTVCVLHQDAHMFPDPLYWAWYMPTTVDFDILPNATFTVGKIYEEMVKGLDSLYKLAFKQVDHWKSL
ncbi:hypothetical protein PAXRUDRAFT_157245, partial [Paxillus rubicundulus Ve08.2h10]